MAQFTNQAQLSYNNSVVNSNIAVGEILEVLSASKSAVMDDYTRTDDVTYVISVVNSGSTAVLGRITVPAATYTQDPDTGGWVVTPGVSTLVVTGNVQPEKTAEPTTIAGSAVFTVTP